MLRILLLGVLAQLIAVEFPPIPEGGMAMAVDATTLNRGLLHARMAIPVTGSAVELVYPRWIPGTHAPGNPVQNLVDLRFRGNGAVLRWDRDEADPWRFRVQIPPGVATVEVECAYITRQPADKSSIAADADGTANHAVINWNTVALYPAGRTVADLPVTLALDVPAGWTVGSALTLASEPGAVPVRFATCSLRDLVDRPLVAGKDLATIRLPNRRGPATFVHGVCTEAGALDPAWGPILGRVVDEGIAVCGRAHYREYHFLIAAGSGHMGLEHAESSLNGIEPEAYIDYDRAEFHDRSVMSHEFFHSWCGKHIRPAGMIVPDFQETQRTGLLWVYEGMTTYYGYVLAARAGMADEQTFRARLVDMALDLARQTGRRWRSVEDTARAGWLLRGQSKHRHDLRRGQEYYPEGALFWMAADVRIRRATAGRSSLDDVCRTLFAAPVDPGGSRAFTVDEVIAALNAVYPADWEELIRARITGIATELDLRFLEDAGWRIAYRPTPDRQWMSYAMGADYLDFSDTLGASFLRGEVYSLVTDGLLDRAGIHDGTRILQVGESELSGPAMIGALNAAKTGNGTLTMTVIDDEGQRDVIIACATGPRFPVLERIADRPDVLADILAPRALPPMAAPAQPPRP